MKDTSAEFEKLYHKLLKEKSGEERFLMGLRMGDAARKMVLASFPQNLTEVEKRIKLFIRYYGNDFSDEVTKEIINEIEKNYKALFNY